MKLLLFAGIACAMLAFVSAKRMRCFQFLGIDKEIDDSVIIITCQTNREMCFRSYTGLTNGSIITLRTCLEESQHSTPELDDLIANLPGNVTLSGRFRLTHCFPSLCNIDRSSSKTITSQYSIIIATLLLSILYTR